MIRVAITMALSMLYTLAMMFAPIDASQAAPTTPKAVAKADPAMMRMVDCEDYDIQPCYTYDDGSYRMVTSYSPYRSVKLSVCKVEDGGPNLPCIWKKNNRVTKGQPITRNVFTK